MLKEKEEFQTIDRYTYKERKQRNDACKLLQIPDTETAH